MAFTTSEQAEIKALFTGFLAEVNKKRIPELQPYSTYGQPSVNDLLALWMAGTNKTVHIPIGMLAEFFITGETGSVGPVLTGDTFIHEVTLAEAGGYNIYEPSLAGMNFFLREEGRPMKPSQFNVLAGGGAEIIKFDELGNRIPLKFGQLYDLEVYELQAGGNGGTSTGTGSVFRTAVNATINTLLSPAQANNLVQLRGGNTAITITLPDAAGVPDGSYFLLEATVNNNKESQIKSTGGQYIYVDGKSLTTVYIRPGESVWLVKMGSAWYDANRFGEIYRQVGNIEIKHYSQHPNEIIADGRPVKKSEYQRLWLRVQASGDVILSESAWQASDDKGKYADIDGDTFRVPLFAGYVLKGASSTRGAGTFESDALKSHNHVDGPYNKAGGRATEVGFSGTTSGGLDSTGATNEYKIGNMNDADWASATIKAVGGAENLVKTMGVVYTIKA